MALNNSSGVIERRPGTKCKSANNRKKKQKKKTEQEPSAIRLLAFVNRAPASPSLELVAQRTEREIQKRRRRSMSTRDGCPFCCCCFFFETPSVNKSGRALCARGRRFRVRAPASESFTTSISSKASLSGPCFSRVSCFFFSCLSPSPRASWRPVKLTRADFAAYLQRR